MAPGSGERYRLLIVDDERVIREGLMSVVDWTALGFEVGGVFASAQSALKALEEREAHALLVDIKMPGLNGLDLISRARARYPHLLAVVLSGYDSFEYARSAIDCGVFGYLLKPVREHQLIEIFQRVRSTLDDRESARAREEALAQTDASVQLLHLLKEGSVTPMGLQRLLAAEPRLASFDAARVMRIELVPRSVDPWDQRESRRQQRQCEFGLALAALEPVTHRFGAVAPDPGDRAILVVLTGSGDAILARAQELFSATRDAMTSCVLVTSASALGRPVSKLDELRGSLVSASATMQRRRCDGVLGLLISDESEDEHSSGSGRSHSDLADRFAAAVSRSSVEDAEGVVAAFFDRLCESRITDGVMADALIRSLIDGIARRLSMHGIPQPFTAARLAALFAEAREWVTYRETAAMVAQGIPSFFAETAEYRSDPRNAAIISTVDHIREHLADDLAQEALADRCAMSVSYFSRLFKHVVGENFKDYLVNRRLDAARRQLRTTTLKVYEIAEAVGYRDQQYFSDVFKRKVGVTPLEYRNRAWESPQ